MSATHPFQKEPAADHAAPSAAPASLLPEGFRSSSPEDRVPLLLAYALEVAAGEPPRAEDAPSRRAEAEATLSEWAFRHLHNHLAEIRAEAAREALKRQPAPPGFLAMVGAGLCAILIAAFLAWGMSRLGLLSLPQLPG